MDKAGEEAIIYDGRICMPYLWAVGKTGSFFLTELRDHARLWGSRCPACGAVFMPPRKNCPRCVVTDTTWVQLSPRGILLTYTVVRYSEAGLHPVEAPFAYGIVQLDGADTGLTHLLGEVDLEQLRPGLRVEAVFKEQELRRGEILDLLYFRPERGDRR